MSKPKKRRPELLTVLELAAVAAVSVGTVRRELGRGLKWYPGRGLQKLISRADWAAWRGGGPPVAITPAAVASALVEGNPDELEVLKQQLLRLKADAYDRLQAADGLSPSQRACLAREFYSYSEGLRKLARQLPEIEAAQDRYVDCERVGALLGRAAAIVGAELDQVGIGIAERCVGADAKAIRTLIDDAVDKARGRLTEELQRFIETEK
jgi:hypothetical protein